MRTEPTFLKNLAWNAQVLMGAILFVQCSSKDGTANSTMNADGTTNAPMEESVTADELNAEVNATYAEHDASGNVTGQDGSSTSTTVVYTPAKERMMTTNDMRGLRGLLVADLEAVRLRLNDGARPTPAREADKALAADLAQGLERVDRALAALGAADDATWSSIREVRMKEVSEVRSWMADYRAKDGWAMK